MIEVDPNRVIQFMAAEAATDREKIARLLAENEFLKKRISAIEQQALKNSGRKPIQLPQRAPVVNRQEE
jgi:hypothetical protein